MIEISQLDVTFADGTVGLSDINLSVSEGEFIALIGPSGSGKTTLLRTVAGFVAPTKGTIAIAGADMTSVAPEKRNLGMVFQQHAVWPHMSVFDNVAYPLRRLNCKKAELTARVEEALALVGLADFGARKPSCLSGGQRQRVALARAVVARPQVLLLDEALSALDEPLRDSLRRDILALAKDQGLTTLHVTHDRAEALALADRVVVLGKGKIQQVATPAELLRAPASAEVARFIADATILPDGSAVLPADITLDPRGEIRGVVESVLFERTGFSVTVRSAGLEYRTFATSAPRIGDEVGLRLNRVLEFS
ncbi:ABC transporter ATP-binding protein [Staphylococcus chromogenes]|nr:ABC transporter ATP-binding protein [Staphylococcus chromogenes]